MTAVVGRVRRRVLASVGGRFAVRAVCAIIATMILWNWSGAAYRGNVPWPPVTGLYLLAGASWIHGYLKGRHR